MVSSINLIYAGPKDILETLLSQMKSINNAKQSSNCTIILDYLMQTEVLRGIISGDEAITELLR